MLWGAVGDCAHDCHRHAIRACQCHIDGGNGEIPHEINALVNVMGCHQRHAGRGRTIRAGKGRPGNGGHMTGGGHGFQLVMGAGQHRAIFRAAQGDRDGRGILDRDDLASALKGHPAPRCAILLGVGGIELLHVDVLIVHVGGRHPPAQTFGPARQHQRKARDRGPDDTASFKLQPRQIPDCGRGQSQMRIMRQQACPSSRALWGSRPGIRCADKRQLLYRIQGIARGQGPSGHLRRAFGEQT